MTPLISVLMPVLNEQEYVAKAIQSVLAQEDVDVEVLVVDGMSSDDTTTIVRQIAHRDQRVRLLTNHKVRIPAALNIGLQNARGPFVARVDAHATVDSRYLRTALSHLLADPQLASVGGIRIGVHQTPRGRAVALALSSRFGVGDSINHFAQEFQYTDHASFGVTRVDVARSIGGWDESLLVSEDVDFDLRIQAQGGRIAFDPAMHIYWTVRPDAAGLFKQYRRYGRGKASLIRKMGAGSFRLRYLAPPLLSIGTVGLLIIAVRVPVVLGAFIPYLAALGFGTRSSWKRRSKTEKTSLPTLPLAFLAMHYGWGLGFLEGLLLRSRPALASGLSASRGGPRTASL